MYFYAAYQKSNMQKLFTFFLVVFITTFSTYAQFSKCSTQEHEDMLKAQYPDYEAKKAEVEAFTAKFIEKHKSTAKTSGGIVISIPVVFHVVYKTAAQNIPDERLIEQLAILNADFRRMNADTTDTPEAFAGVGADCEIEFCLAVIDPDGNPTTGIIRAETTVTTFNTSDDMKFTASGGSDAWPAEEYLNFWSCNLGVFLLGYAQFPGGPANTDGVVINYLNVGLNAAGYPYHLGRTATHEVGHWLNLYHIWGDDVNCAGSDLVGDTPNQKVETYGCPAYPKTDMCSVDDPGIMFQNYMDYTDDACMNIVTEGQKSRILALFEPGGDRFGLTTSEGCGLQPYDAQAIASLPGGTVCDLSVIPIVTIKNHGTEVLTSVDIVYSIDGAPTSTFAWAGSLTTGMTEDVSLPSITTIEGEHTLEATLENPNGFIDADAGDNTTETDFLVSLTALPVPLTQGFEVSGFPYDGYTISNPDGYYTWERTNDAASLGSYSIYMNHFNNDAIGEIDEFVLPAYDISTLATISFAFDVAYAIYTSSGIYSDTLEVLVSDNCGETWTGVYKKATPDLQTAPFHTVAFVPEDDEWRTESIDLSSYLGSEQLFIKFRTISDYENNLYIDNINLADSAQINIFEQSNDFAIDIYPNPANELINIRFNIPENDPCNLIIYDITGRIVFNEILNVSMGINTKTIPVEFLEAGYYRLKLENSNSQSSMPFVK